MLTVRTVGTLTPLHETAVTLILETVLTASEIHLRMQELSLTNTLPPRIIAVPKHSLVFQFRHGLPWPAIHPPSSRTSGCPAERPGPTVRDQPGHPNRMVQAAPKNP